ncbi:MAG: ACT domain-containing protein [Oscillospiraceae bacterium]|nr:ACT domain-containing protein [Oscillospiraceae bacterium]
MELQKIEGDFCVCKIESIAQIDFTRELLFVAKAPDEISLVCESAHVPSNAVEIEKGWKALRISGTLDFGLVGVVAKISSILADAQISIFVVSTYNTDYILMKEERLCKGLQTLINNGYVVNEV